MEKLSEGGFIVIDGNTLDKEDIIGLIRLQKQLLIEENILFTIDECETIWSNYSNSLCASWLYFPKEDESILPMIKGSDYFNSFEEWCTCF